MSVALIALKTMHYGGRLVLAGQPFTATSDQDARLLLRLKRAKRAQHAPTYHTAGLDAEEVADAVVETVGGEDAPRRKRTYRRRDLTAESSE